MRISSMPAINQRIYSGIILAALFGLVILKAPVILNCVMMAVIIAVIMLEFYAIIRQMGIPVFKYLGTILGILLICATLGAYTSNRGAQAAQYELAILFGAVVAVCIRQFPQRLNGKPIPTIACTLLGILYIPFLFNFFTKLGLSWETAGLFDGVGLTGRMLCFYLIAVVKCTDIGAYLIGVRFGKHKLFPRLSPAKTWEGFFGGALFGLAVSFMLYSLSNGHFGHKTMRLNDALALGVLLPLFGMTGDLVESLLKRAGGAKDAGVIIPGMGGLLDVLDSLIVAVPVFYFYCLWILPSTY